jgi:hypothetical protein
MTEPKNFDILKWGAFKIPGFTFAVIGLLLIMRSPENNQEFEFIQFLVKYAIGAAVISYAQSLLHSNFMALDRGKDLPTWLQIVFLFLHLCWFIYWFMPLPGCYA